MDQILTSFKDLIKYKIISGVNTGDRTLDNLMSGTLVTIVTILFGYISFDFLNEFIVQIRMKIKRKVILDEQTCLFYSKYIHANKNKFKHITWITTEDKVNFYEKACLFTAEALPWKFILKMLLNTNTGNITSEYYSIVGAVTLALNMDEHLPIYIEGNNIVGIHKSISGVSLFYNNQDTFDKVRLKMMDMKSIVRKSDLMINFKDDKKFTLFKDRNFDMIVSKHKERLLNLISNFKDSLKGVSNFGGYGGYNLGIILYGKPGTGKTLYIKAICNALGRDANIIDMREIKTHRNFEELFLDPEKLNKYVYVLDEFDCIQGVIKNRSLENGKEEKDELSNLKEEYIKLMTCENNNKELLQTEIEELKKKIKIAEKALTLDTMLTVLDGVIEMRGRVIIATTNHIDRIDPALIREGRFDDKLELTEFNDSECRQLLEKMFHNEDTTPLKEVKFREGEFTPAKIINLAYKHKTLKKIIEIMKE